MWGKLVYDLGEWERGENEELREGVRVVGCDNNEEREGRRRKKV